MTEPKKECECRCHICRPDLHLERPSGVLTVGEIQQIISETIGGYDGELEMERTAQAIHQAMKNKEGK